MSSLLRTITNLAFVPLIVKCYYKHNFHGFIFTLTMIFSMIFHLQEELNITIIFGYWFWLAIDTFFSMLSIISVCHFLICRSFDFSTFLFIVIEVYLDILFCSIPNGMYLHTKNYLIFGVYAILIIHNYQHVILSNTEQLVCLTGYLFGILSMLFIQNTYGHSLWHIFMQLTTFMVYLFYYQRVDQTIEK